MRRTIIFAAILACAFLVIFVHNLFNKNEGEIAFCVNGQKIYSCPIPYDSPVIRLWAAQYWVKLPEKSSAELYEATRALDLKAGDIQQIFWNGREISTVVRRGNVSETAQLTAQYFPPEYVSVFFDDEKHADKALKNYRWKTVRDFSDFVNGSSSSIGGILGSVFSTIAANDFVMEERSASVYEDEEGRLYIEKKGKKVFLPEKVSQSIFSPNPAPDIDEKGEVQIPRVGTWFEL